MRWARRWALAATALLCPLGAGVAHADDPSASALIDEGIDLREAQRDSEALLLFEKAQALSPTPRGQAQVALAQQALGRWVGAERNLNAALARKNDPWISSHRPVLERALSVIQSHLGEVQLVGVLSGNVYVDGVHIDDPDALTHLRLEVGRRMLEVRAVGMYPFSRVIDVRVGETERVEVAQHPLLDDGAHGTTGAALGDPGRTQRTLGWVFVGGAGLFIATGAASLVARAVYAGDFNSNQTCTSTAPANLVGQCSTWYNGGQTAQTISIVGFVGGGLFGAISIALLLTAPSSKAKAAALAMPYSCSPSAGGLFCGVSGKF